MSTLATLNVVLNGDIGGFLKSMKQAEEQSSSSSNIIQKALGGIGNVATPAAGATIAGVAAIGAAAFSSAMQFDDAFDTIAIGTGATGDALDGLKKDFQNIYTSFPTDTDNAAKVVTELNKRLGITGQNLTDLAGPVLEASRLLGGDAQQNAALFSRVIGDWGVPIDQAATMLDKLFVVSQRTGIPLERLQEQIVQFGSPLRLMGFGLDESAAMLGKWEKEGVNTELVLGSLRIAAGKFAKENVPLRDGLMKTITQIQGMKDSSKALALGMQVFGARAGPDMVAAIREGRLAVGDLVTAMQDADGAILETAKNTADFPEKFTVLKNKVVAALAPLGMLIMDAIGKALDAIGPVLDKITGALSDFMEGAQAGGGFDVFQGLANVFYGLAGADPTSIFQGIGDAFLNLSTTVQPVIDGFINGFNSILSWVQANWPQIQNTIVTTWNNIRALVEPAINAIAAFIQSVFGAIGTFLQTHGEDIKSFIGQTWNTIRSIVEPVIQWFYETVTNIFGGLATWINENQSGIQQVFQGVWDGIKMFVGTVLAVIRGIVQAVLALLRGDVSGALDAIKNIFVNVWDGIKDYLGRAVETVRMILLIAWKAISDAVSNAWNGIRTFIENAWDGIINFFKTLPDKLFAIGKQIIEGLWNGIKSMFDQIGQGISDFFQNTINDAKKTLGIQSPSALFAEIGVNLMAGLALGIRRSAMLPQEQLAAATADLSADATLHMQTLLDSSRSGSRQSSAGQPGGTGATIINNNYITDSLSARIILEQQRQDLLRSTREAY